jgi:hypothetical protein
MTWMHREESFTGDGRDFMAIMSNKKKDNAMNSSYSEFTRMDMADNVTSELLAKGRKIGKSLQ